MNARAILNNLTGKVLIPKGITNSILYSIIAVAAVMGCCGNGHSMPLDKKIVYESLNSLCAPKISRNDSIIIQICEIMDTTQSLSRRERKAIERRIRSFPHRILRRDTISYFLETALGVAYYEFDQKNYRKALTYVDEFDKNAMPKGLWKSFWAYNSVGFNARNSIIEKGCIKSKPTKKAWLPLTTGGIWGKLDYKFSLARSRMYFLDNFIDDVPVDGALATYDKLLFTYWSLGGKLVWLNSYSTSHGFLQKCLDNGREDIFDIICKIWSVNRKDFQWNADRKQIAFNDTTLKPAPALNAKYSFNINRFSLEWHKNRVDSLISCNETDSIGYNLYRLIDMAYQRHRYSEVERYCKKYESVCPVSYRMSLYNHWGLAESYLGLYESSVKHLEKALKYANTNDVKSTIYNNLACSYIEAGDYGKAIALFHEHEPDPHNPFSQFCWYDNLGYAYSHISPSTALSYYNNAEHYLDDGILYGERKARHFCRKARVLTDNPYRRRLAIERALEYSRQEFCDSLTIGMAYTELGRFYNDIFDYEKAEHWYGKAALFLKHLEHRDKRNDYLATNRADNLLCLMSTDSIDSPETVSELSDEYVKARSPLKRIRIALRLEKALRDTDGYDMYCSKLIYNVKKDIVNAMLSLSAQESTSLQKPLQELLNGMLARIADADTECINPLALSLFKKGLSFTTRTVIEQRLNRSRGTRKQLKRLNGMREDLNFAIAFGDKNKIDALSISIPELERKLNARLALDGNMCKLIDRTLDQVYARLAENDVAVDFVRYELAGIPSYGAFVIRKSEDPVFIKLFQGEPDSISGKMVWGNLISYFNTNGQIYFSTDGILNRFGIEFMSSDGEDIMLHCYNLHRVFHIADISKSEGKVGKHLTAIGVSDYNSPIERGETLYRSDMVDLPNVEYEIELIQSKYPDSSLRIYFNDEAREARVKAMDTKNITALHISTHGFFIGNDSLVNASGNAANPNFNIARRACAANKSSLSGLVLRGGNWSWKTPEILDEEDDLLTSDEIETMSFPKLQLTVLSACESGLGNIDSDGVWGLQRAFRIAGSRNLICSLNKVDDYWTAQFMDIFYGEAAKGKNIYDSFRIAQRTLYEMEPHSPKIWSSFILIE